MGVLHTVGAPESGGDVVKDTVSEGAGDAEAVLELGALTRDEIGGLLEQLALQCWDEGILGELPLGGVWIGGPDGFTEEQQADAAALFERLAETGEVATLGRPWRPTVRPFQHFRYEEGRDFSFNPDEREIRWKRVGEKDGQLVRWDVSGNPKRTDFAPETVTFIIPGSVLSRN